MNRKRIGYTGIIISSVAAIGVPLYAKDAFGVYHLLSIAVLVLINVISTLVVLGDEKKR